MQTAGRKAVARTLAVLMFIAVPRSALSAPPLTTDDAATMAPGACQLETEQRGFRHRTELDAIPSCNLFLDAEIAAGYLRVAPESAQRSHGGFYQIKKVFVPVEEGRWGLGASAAITRTAAGPSKARLDYYTLLLTRQLDGTMLHLNLGGVLDRDAGTAVRRNRTAWGVAVEHDMGLRWTAVAEAFGQQGLPEAAQAGLRWWAVPRRVQLTGSLGAQRGQGKDGRWVSLGVRFESGEYD